MKKKIVYVAADGKEFAREEDCVHYETEGASSRLKDLYSEANWMKQVELPSYFKKYENWLNKYRKTCNTRMSSKERLFVITGYLNAKHSYEISVKHYQEIRSSIKELRTNIEKIKENQ